MRPNTDVTAVQRVVRLLFMIGMVIAAYLVLSLFDRAARADTGVTDHIARANPAASAKGLVADAKKVRPPAKVPAPKVSTPKAPKTLRPAKVVKAPKVFASKAASKVASVKTAARAVVSRPSKVVAARPPQTDLTRVRTAPKAPALPDLSTATRLPTSPEIPGPLALPALPRLELSALPRWELPAPLPAVPQVPVQLDRAAPGGPGPKPVPALPGPPEHPGNQATTTGHVRDSGGGNAPTTGTVSSSWRPDLVAAGFGTPADLTVRGRTVRYSGPPS